MTDPTLEMPLGVELLDLLIPGSLVIGDALLYSLVEHGVLGAGDAGSRGQERACGQHSAELPLMLDQEFTSAMQATLYCVPHHQVLSGVGDGRHGVWGDPAGLSEVFSELRGYIRLCSPVHRKPAGGVHDGGVRSPGHCVGDDVLLARDVVDREPVPHGLQLVVQQAGVVDVLQGLVCSEYCYEGVVVNTEDEVGEASYKKIAFLHAVEYTKSLTFNGMASRHVYSLPSRVATAGSRGGHEQCFWVSQ